MSLKSIESRLKGSAAAEQAGYYMDESYLKKSFIENEDKQEITTVERNEDVNLFCNRTNTQCRV